ncbi:MAG: N-acetyltransferase [Flavipsychrobacter sp.]|nr:N-acetyltransferase [Flavipsychrobacter sp.]
MSTSAINILSAAHTLHTPRLQLKLLTPELWSEFMTHATDDEMASTLALTSPPVLALEKAKHRSGMTTHFISFRNFLLVDRETGVTIGKAGFHTWQARHSRAEIGYGIDIESYKRKGLMKEALKAILHYGFDEMGLHRVEAFAGPANIASISLLEGLGFTKEGLLRGHYCKDGDIQDSACYGLLKPEFETVKARW